MTDVHRHQMVDLVDVLGPDVLREYAFLADGQRGALIGPRGDICWMCAPTWESGAIFSSLIGGAGSFRVTPSGRFVWGGHYEAGTLIWRSRWVTEEQVAVCREALAYPGDPHRAVILRRIEPRRMAMDFQVRMHLAAEFGQRDTTELRREHGVFTGRSGALRWRLSGVEELRAGAEGDDPTVLSATIRVAANRRRDIILEVSDHELPRELPDADDAWRRTEATWEQRVPRAHGTSADDDVTHSRAVLRGMTEPGGGMVAAATMSLPERAEEGRNYDYRYVWLRDQAIAGQAAAAIGAGDLLRDAAAFAAARVLADGPKLSPAYTLAGSPIPGEHRLDLAGYPGGYDIAGNHVNEQFQLDVFGEVLLLLAAARRHGLDDESMDRAADIAADAISARRDDPDAGVWELDPNHWAHSRLICAAGLRAAADAGAPGDREERWRRLADTLVTQTERDCAGPSGPLRRAPNDDRVDAALLLPFLRDPLPGGQPRRAETIEAIERDLAHDFFVYRFRHDDRDLACAEGVFLLCGFAMAMIKHRDGDAVAAARYFERNRTACGPPGLLSEEYDVLQRQMRGNLPQAFVHAMLIESAACLAGP